LLLLIAVVVAIVWYANHGGNNSPVRELGAAPEILNGIGMEGSGGDALLNREKNRFTTPGSFSEASVRDIIQIPSTVLGEAGRKKREYWPPAARRYVDGEEGQGFRVTGYLIRAKESGPESCNGYSDSLRDYHIWIGDRPDDEKAQSLIVEITPRWKVIHPEWRLHTIERLCDEHARVRVSGWLMWDEEHPDEVGKSRGSQWEIHPVTSFEVFNNGEWVSLKN